MSEGNSQSATLRHRDDAKGSCPRPFEIVDRADFDPTLIDPFTQTLYAADSDTAALREWIDRHAPLPLPSLMLELLTPAARRLGEMWVADECGFCDVTLGMHRLTMLMIAVETDHGIDRREHGGRILVSCAPGDQHGFGAAMLASFLRRAGWDVTGDLAGDADEIIAEVSRNRFAVLALSIGHERAILPTAALIARARAASRDPDIKVLVGGPMIAADPARVALVGADATAEDGPSAVALLERFTAEKAEMLD